MPSTFSFLFHQSVFPDYHTCELQGVSQWGVACNYTNYRVVKME